MEVCRGCAFKRRYGNRLLSWVLKGLYALSGKCHFWQRISQTLKVEVGFGRSVWSSVFHLKKGPSTANFNTWHAAFPPPFQPCKQWNNQWQQSKERQQKHVKQLANLFHSLLSYSSGVGAFFCFIIVWFLLHIFFFLFWQLNTLVFCREQLENRISDTGASVNTWTESQALSSALRSAGWMSSPVQLPHRNKAASRV